MGQKVHPKGLRLGILFNWSSRWFFSNKKKYQETLITDLKIRDFFTNRYAFASVTQVEIERTINRVTLIIYSVKPGIIIGQGGKGLEEVKQLLLTMLNGESYKKGKQLKIDIKIEAVKKPYLNAYYVATNIVEKLKRNFPHRAVVHRLMDRVMEAGAKGVKIQLGGRIAGAEISRREKYFQGVVSTSTIREDIDYASVPCLTRSGYIGVKVWIGKK